MNLENLEKLAQWLEAGAPEAVFSMNVGLAPADQDTIDTETAYVSINHMITETGQTGKGACGSVCCIAGASALMSMNDDNPDGLFPSFKRQSEIHRTRGGWGHNKREALYFLGLDNNDCHFGHDLFDSDLAPDNCTPAQAAVAVRKVMAGKEPWV